MVNFCIAVLALYLMTQLVASIITQQLNEFPEKKIAMTGFTHIIIGGEWH